MTDMIFVGLGIFLGGLVGLLTLVVAGLPLTLTASGGALIMGLVFGWLRAVHPTFGRIPEIGHVDLRYGRPVRLHGLRGTCGRAELFFRAAKVGASASSSSALSSRFFRTPWLSCSVVMS